MIVQTSERRTLLTFCTVFAKCPKYGERLGAIIQGEDLTSGTLQRAAQIDLLSRRRRGGKRGGMHAFAVRERDAGAMGGAAGCMRLQCVNAARQTRVLHVNAARARRDARICSM